MVQYLKEGGDHAGAVVLPGSRRSPRDFIHLDLLFHTLLPIL